MTWLIVFVCLTVLVAAVFHYLIPDYLFASVIAAVASVVAFVAIGIAIEGYLDPFLVIAIFFYGLYGLGISLIVGIPIALHRRRKQRRSLGCCQSCGYNLTGNISGVCPECGKPASAP